MRIGVIGAGRIGGGAARLLARAGHELLLSYSRDPDKLRAQAEEIGAQAGTPAEAAAFGDVVILAVPWPAIDDAVAQAGSLDGRIVIDTTNPFGGGGWEVPEGRTTTQVNQERLAGAHVVKSFNTLTAAFVTDPIRFICVSPIQLQFATRRHHIRYPGRGRHIARIPHADVQSRPRH